jgi:predicted Zn-dependent protease
MAVRCLAALAVSLVSATGWQTVQTADPGAAIERELSQKLLSARRIFVESFGDDAVSKLGAAMLIDAIRVSKRFIITENREKADVVLKGTASEKSRQELYSGGSSTAVRSMAISDSQASTETITEACITVRMVTTDGDVVWTTAQESRGAKFKGASADAAEKVVKQLLRDLEKLARPRPATK